jgi:hypothetical protein
MYCTYVQYQGPSPRRHGTRSTTTPNNPVLSVHPTTILLHERRTLILCSFLPLAGPHLVHDLPDPSRGRQKGVPFGARPPVPGSGTVGTEAVRTRCRDPRLATSTMDVGAQIDGAGAGLCWGCRMWHREGERESRRGRREIGENGNAALTADDQRGKGEREQQARKSPGNGRSRKKITKKAITITAPVHLALLSHRVSRRPMVRVVWSSHLISYSSSCFYNRPDGSATPAMLFPYAPMLMILYPALLPVDVSTTTPILL